MTENEYDGCIFVAAPRQMSAARFTQIVKRYLPKASIVLGVSNEPYVVGFEGQPQFRMLTLDSVRSIIDRVNASMPARRIHVLQYAQSELATIVDQHNFSRVLLVNGSWKYTFQNHPAFAVLTDRQIPFKYISPFTDEDEARAYAASHMPHVSLPAPHARLDQQQMMALADGAASQSFDYSFQTGVVLGRERDDGYEFLLSSYNKVIPYQAYALHHGNAREKHVSRTHDTNHYDTIHAEMYLLTQALHQGLALEGATVFINVLPCPNCARTLSQTDIREIVYVRDHSDGYAVTLLESCGIHVRRLDGFASEQEQVQ